MPPTPSRGGEGPVIPCHGSLVPMPWFLIYIPSAGAPQACTSVISSKYLKGVFPTIPLGMGKKVPKHSLTPTETCDPTHQHPPSDLHFPSTWLPLGLWGLRSHPKGQQTSQGREASSSSNISIIISITVKEGTRPLPARARERK